MIYGLTDKKRSLVVVLALINGNIYYPITAWEANEEQKKFLKWR